MSGFVSTIYAAAICVGCRRHYTITKLCKSAQFHLRNISKIRKHPNNDSTEIIIHVFVSSKLDHCNSLLYGLPAYKLHRLQLLQDTAARIVTLTRKYDHITPVLQSLHLLPVNFIMIFKILLLVYKGLNNLAPSYITDMLSYRNCSRSLRAASMKYLALSKTNTKTYVVWLDIVE